MDIKNIQTKNDIKKILESQNYIPSMEIIYTLYNAIKLKMPILVEGPAGTGKTELSKVLKDALGLELIRMQCYEGLDASKTIYEWDYSKQMLLTQIMQPFFKGKLDGVTSPEEAVKVIGGGSAFYNEDFLLERPLLQSITSDKQSILLIDELDKADEEFEALLLEFLGEFSVTIPEYQTIKCKDGNEPIVILTSNSKRELSDALKRRCAYLYIDYPTEKLEAEIIEKKANVDSEFALKVAKAVARIRNLDRVKQKPSISESIVWAQSLMLNLGVENFNSMNKEDVDLTLSILLKNKKDIDIVKASGYLSSL